ncbi:hypothetical protein EHS25_003720 [Saitozyma podzolica]|uniref:Asl1-like glycosyl hydrolase catalytic domain-containing protein n=1 Tax=Saitozyma podzolica TaxID=1890683 RepID=A0A427Y3D6_9TREE|nr:hypothetical protein EHS25_003720 [Saitozyma podzolica]
MAPPSGKAGISWPCQELTSDPVASFFQPGSVRWHRLALAIHDSGPTDRRGVHPDDRESGMDAVLMGRFAPDYLNNGDQLQTGWRCLLGYNEPDHHDPTVAVSKSAHEAAAAWIELAKLRVSPDQKLVTPAVAWNLNWMKEFLSLLPDQAKPDYLAIHVYTTTFESFRDKVEEYHRTFGLPIMLTEFAMQSFDPNVPPPQTQQQVHDFMGQTTAWLDETDYVMQVLADQLPLRSLEISYGTLSDIRSPVTDMFQTAAFILAYTPIPLFHPPSHHVMRDLGRFSLLASFVLRTFQVTDA